MGDDSAVRADWRESQEWRLGEYAITTDRNRIDLDVVHGFLSRSYWAEGRSRERVADSLKHSLVFGLCHGESLVGFARVVTDYVTIAFLADVFVLQEHRGKGLGSWLVEIVTSLPDLRRVRRFLLGTRDAAGLYRKFGFGDPAPGVLMERIQRESEREPKS